MRSLKILVVGANGQIGKQVVHLLSETSDHTVTAMLRKEEQVGYFTEKGIKTVLASLEDTVDDLQKAIGDAEAVIFTAGSGGSTGYDKTLLIDLDGAVKTIEAAEKSNVKRYIMVSALQADNRENWNEKIKPYYVAKHYADKALMNSELTYTIVRPGGLLNDAGTGKITVGKNLTRGTIPREDVAKTIVASISEQTTFNKSFDVISGETSIEEAIQTLA